MKKKCFLALICLILSNLQAASDSKDIAKLKALISERILKIFPNVEKNPNEVIYPFEERKSRNLKEDVLKAMPYLYDEITPLLIAIDDGDVASVKALLQLGAHANLKGFNYIRQAAGNSHFPGKQKEYVEIAKLLHDAGAPIDDSKLGERSALMLAAGGENPGFVKYLIDNGANVISKHRNDKDSLNLAEIKLKTRQQSRYDITKAQAVVDILREAKKHQQEHQEHIAKQIYESEILPKDLANIVGKYS